MHRTAHLKGSGLKAIAICLSGASGHVDGGGSGGYSGACAGHLSNYGTSSIALGGGITATS